MCNTCAPIMQPVWRFGVPFETVKTIQSGTHTCAICNRKQKLVIDHCHRTGVTRGFLCTRCNNGLGMFEDSSAILMKAAAYLDATARLPADERSS